MKNQPACLLLLIRQLHRRRYARNNLCQRALELIEQQATQHGAKRVTGVWLKIGAFSCVETSALLCFDLVCRGTLAEGCKLHLEEQEAECWCESCQQYVTLLTQRVRRCPQCNSDMLRIVADDGLQIRRIEIDELQRRMATLKRLIQPTETARL